MQAEGPIVPLPVRVVVALACAVLGVAASTCTVLLHATGWGLALGVITTVAVLVALPGGWWARLAFALPWSLTVVAFAPERAEGDLLITADLWGYGLLAAAVGVLVGGLVGVRHRPHDSGGPGPVS